MPSLFKSALAGCAATVPMTLVMTALFQRLPPEERYALPPGEITAKLTEEARLENHVDQPTHEALTLASHFGYGAAAGAVYAPLANRLPLPPLLGGAVFGLALWAASYLGWLPAAGILRPAAEHPARRNALMIAAHVVWGGTLGLLLRGSEDGH